MAHNKPPRTPSRRANPEPQPDVTLTSLEQELAFLVRWLEAAQRRRRYQLERAHYLVLLLLVEDGPQSVSQIASRLRLDTSTVTRQVTVMTELGLVNKQPKPEDRRGGMICATARGHTETGQVRQAREQRVSELVADWPEGKRQALAETLGDLNDALCRILDED